MRGPLFEIHRSPIEGVGAFALCRIRRGTRIVEYTGERITQVEADKRYQAGAAVHPHVLLFNVDDKIVVDAAVGGNDSRFINHSCDPNCESMVRRGRIWILALCDIEPGEELTYDYSLTGEDLSPDEQRRLYPCHCGTARCRGTLFDVALTTSAGDPESF
jgi:uncharacterized protein